MLVTSKYFQTLLLLCTSLTSAIFKITPLNTLNDGKSFAQNSKVSLNCTNHPYPRGQTWIFDSVKVAECGIAYCTENVSNPSRFSFTHNISTGIFIFTMNPVLKEDDTKVIECYDGNSTIKFTIKVSDEGRTASDDLSAGQIAGIVTGLIVAIFIIVCLCIWCIYLKKHKRHCH